MPSREMHWGRFRNIYSGTDTLHTEMMLRHGNAVLNPQCTGCALFAKWRLPNLLD
jgi:hypothetical protein